MNELTLFENAQCEVTRKTPIEVLLRVSDDGTVSARNVYKFLELAEGQFSRWAKTNILENEFAVKGEDFEGLDINVEGNIVTDYRLSIYFAKKLCMKSGGDRGEQARDYFVKVEEAHKEMSLAFSALSPQLQALINMEIKQAEMQKQLNAVTVQAEVAASALTAIKDTMAARDEDWRKGLNKMFNAAVHNSSGQDYRALRDESYKLLEDRAGCDLGARLRNLVKRLIDSGATKTQIGKTNRLDVIEADNKLKEIYTSIVKEISIRYVNSVPKASTFTSYVQ